MVQTSSYTQSPLISVVITCYNHGRYLSDAIESVLQQKYKPIEILIIDDGSTDNTRAIAQGYAGVKYIYQKNAGLSAARNAGIENSTGEMLLFLDADDWLLQDALEINEAYLSYNSEFAFVSGGHIKVTARNEVIKEGAKKIVTGNYYSNLLHGNYIEMHAAVLYRRWAFDGIRFDTSLKACEDYDVYLKIARMHPVFHHTRLIAAYRFHNQNMSGNIPLMLRSIVTVLDRQRPQLVLDEEEQALRYGIDFCRRFYCEALYQNLLFKLGNRKDKGRDAESDSLKTYNPFLYEKYQAQQKEYEKLTKMHVKTQAKTYLKKLMPNSLLHWYRRQKGAYSFIPPPGKIRLGDLNRTAPFSNQFGFDRGGAVDRYYIETFLQQQAPVIQGRVLEIGDNEYTLRFGGQAVTQSDILHVNEHNPKATFIGDLSNAPHLPSDTFDCIILTQTLHLIYNYNDALQTCHRILKPGGSLLLTSPGITHIDQGEWRQAWLWSFTDTAISRMLSQIFLPENVAVETFGNVLVATAFLYGMGLPELTREQLDATDPHYQVIITAKATKAHERKTELDEFV